MDLAFAPMTPRHAREVVSWRYEKPYHIYNYREEERSAAPGYLADSTNRFFAVLSEHEVVGFRSFGLDGRVAGGVYDETCLDTGGGLRPDLTGKGLGVEILR